ncbi:hypothetical protein ABIE26_004692 [Pedobacter africanus]|uniref:Uncharacterized protein n=1 Tax=Pedobacter africanus TaxID=151894 RepID=A0ACC6L2X7_9SPHI|nr:hypothetical protein [Pedobacter africanus]
MFGLQRFLFYSHADAKSADEFKPEKAPIATTNYKPFHLFLSTKTL